MSYAGLIALSVLAGALNVLQSRVNGGVGVAVGNGLVVGFLSFSVALIVTTAVVLALPRFRRALGRLRRSVRLGHDVNGDMKIRWWHLLGGAGGALFVVSQGSAVPAIGVAIFTVAVVAAQNTNSLIVDRVGLGPAGSQPITRVRLLAALGATAGVAISVVDQFGSPGFNVAALLLALVAGAGAAVQLAVNGRVAVASGTPWVAGFMNYVVGFTAVSLALLVQQLVTQTNLVAIADWFELWMLAGGLLGIMIIVIAALAVRELGVLLFGLSFIVGQMTTALILAVVAPVGGATVSVWLVVGVAVTGCAVAVATITGRPKTDALAEVITE